MRVKSGDEILNNSESFIDEEGKLHLVWREGDTISSVRLNQMVEVVNNAVDEEHQRQINEVNRENRANAKLEELENRFSALTTSQQQSAEVIDARDGEASLKARLDRDVKKPLEYYGDVEGSYISTDSTAGYLKDVEILGNTIQNEDNLEDIRSVGNKIEGQELYEIPVLSCGENLFNPNTVTLDKSLNNTNGQLTDNLSAYTSDYIKCSSGKSYICNRGNITYICIYDKNKSFIKTVNDYKFISEIDGYFRIHCIYADKSVLDFCVVEGDVIKNISYQGDKLTILSPVQLEKVGDVADRIICKDGVWGVEKNIDTVVLNGSENWAYSTSGNYFVLLDDSITNKIKTESVMISDRFKYATAHNNDMAIYGGNTEKLKLSNNSFTDSVSFKQWLRNNLTLVKYQNANTAFIPLPHDQQVKLRTFANKTNISFLTEIEVTIKAQVPKSLGATVNTHTEQISNLNKELGRVKKLEESTVSTVETESDFTTVEATSNGYFEDVKLEGKTLVSLHSAKINNPTTNQYASLTIVTNNERFEVGKTYSMCINSNTQLSNGQITLRYVTGDAFICSAINGVVSFVYTKENSNLVLKTMTSFNSPLVMEVMILEGDHTQNPPSYFEGLKSVGQDIDKIVVSSYGKNLLDEVDIIIGNLSESTGQPSSGTQSVTNNYIRIKPNTRYIVSTSGIINGRFYFYDKRYNFINTTLSTDGGVISPSNAYYIKLRMPSAGYYNAQLEEGTVVTEYEPYKSDKKRLLYYNNETQTWEKPILREWDSIEKHSNGKYYYHQRSGEVVLNGSENWKLNSQNESVIRFNLDATSIGMAGNRNPVISDKFRLSIDYDLSTNEEGIFTSIGGGTLFITISKSKLSTQDVAGFKQWLQANNVTVVYQLAEEKVYECTNIDLITYANETNYIVEAGAITPKSILKVHNNIANVINALQKKVSVLESNYVTLFNTITAAFNSLE